MPGFTIKDKDSRLNNLKCQSSPPLTHRWMWVSLGRLTFQHRANITIVTTWSVKLNKLAYNMENILIEVWLENSGVFKQSFGIQRRFSLNETPFVMFFVKIWTLILDPKIFKCQKNYKLPWDYVICVVYKYITSALPSLTSLLFSGYFSVKVYLTQFRKYRNLCNRQVKHIGVANLGREKSVVSFGFSLV